MLVGPPIIRAVQHTRELERILSLPRRVWAREEGEAFATQLTGLLKRANGQMVLWPAQAMGLYEAWNRGGLLGQIQVGGGKTLLSLLLPLVLGSRRPLLLTRANLIEKTKRDWRELASHWPIPNFIRIESYNKLSIAHHANMLDLYQPDLIIADECHRLKSPRAAVTKRVTRYLDHHPEIMFCGLSGTLTRKSLREWAHLARWALKAHSPVPILRPELEEWAEAIDLKPEGKENQIAPGMLITLIPGPKPTEPKALLREVRLGFQTRLRETEGVVMSPGDFNGSSLLISAFECAVSPDMDQAFEMLRGEEGTTPDGWPIPDALSMYRHGRELALGFYYRWDPRPPNEWLDARKMWFKAIRYILANNQRKLDSELQVTNAVDAGHYPQFSPLLNEWRRVKETFIPHTVPVWFDNSVLTAVHQWTQANPGIVWTEHVAFAEALALRSGLAYYGEKGLDRTGHYIEAHPADQPLIASIASNREGRNLQHKWSKNLITSFPSSGEWAEQVLGRTHRFGQPEDEVTAEVLLTAWEHANAFEQATAQAHHIRNMTGQNQKLLYADITFPDTGELCLRMGARWSK